MGKMILLGSEVLICMIYGFMKEEYWQRTHTQGLFERVLIVVQVISKIAIIPTMIWCLL